jgi:hypothetical protein
MKRYFENTTPLVVRAAAAMRRASFLLLPLLCIVPVHASVLSILYETRPYAGGNLPAASDYVANWDALVLSNPVPPAGYGAGYVPEFTNLSNQGTFGGSSGDIAFHTLITLDVTPSQAGIWNMQFGIDYGWGGALFVDGSLVDFRNTDMWWNGSYADPSQILSGGVNLAVGGHTIELFGLELCCDGATQGRYQAGTQPFQIFEAVPEPGTVTLIAFGIGMLALGSTRRKSSDRPRR